MKKLFLVLLTLLVGMAGLSATPLRPGGGDVTPQMIIPHAGIVASITAPVMPTTIRPGGVFVTAQESAFTQAVELMCLWAEQYRQGLLTADEFKTLVAGRAAVMYIRDLGIGGMKPMAEKSESSLYWELEPGIQKPISLAPAEYPLLC